jgi:hypothetical protein
MNIFGMLILWLLFNERFAGLELELEEKETVAVNAQIVPVDKERGQSKTDAVFEEGVD